MLGIDVSKQTLTATVMVTGSTRPLWEGTVPNTTAGVARLLRHTPASDAWVVEPTGVYSRLVVTAGQAAGRTVLLAQPKRAKAFLAATQPRAKTDRVDSRGLALYGLAAPLRPFPVTSEAMESLDQLLAARKGISRSLASLRQQAAVLPRAAAPLRASISALEEQQRVIDRQIADARAELPLIDVLDEVPGIGAVTATAVAHCLTTKQFAGVDQFVAYIGLDTRVHESGQRVGIRVLSKQGDAELRRLFYLCAQANVRSKDATNPFKMQYAREMAKGLPTTGALCAVARKLAKVCWSLARHGTRYAAGRVHQQPLPAPDARGVESSNALPPLDTQP